MEVKDEKMERRDEADKQNVMIMIQNNRKFLRKKCTNRRRNRENNMSSLCTHMRTI